MQPQQEILTDLTALWTDRWETYLERGFLEQDQERIQKVVTELSSELAFSHVAPRGDHLEMWALCPYHDDINVGSFSISLRTGYWHCFVCGAHGGLKKLLIHLDLYDEGTKNLLRDVDFGALMEAAAKSGSILEEPVPLPESLLFTVKKYRPRRYIERGHPRHILDRLEVGYDHKTYRIIFPVRSAAGHLVGMQSRAAFPGNAIRWKWYRDELRTVGPEEMSEVFLEDYSPPRSTVLYGEHLVMQTLARGGYEGNPVVLCEGMGGTLRLIASGFPTMAPFGTEMGPGQQFRLSRALRRTADWGKPATIVLVPDADQPGIAAAVHHALSLAGFCTLKIAELPQGLDPEDCTHPQLREAVALAQPLAVKLRAKGWWGSGAREALAQILLRNRSWQKRR
jgi:hypothetical protein